MKTSLRFSFLLMAVLAIFLYNCKEEELPHNPFDDIDYGTTTPPADTTQPNTIVWIHKNILQPKCATPGCHDGSFEPDYRTVESSYNTLVYHPLVKYDTTGYFQYRVKPFDVAHSWLHERLGTNDAVLGRMPLYSDPLSDSEMTHINTWIADGAKDIFGNVRLFPNAEPIVAGYICTNATYTARYDTVRVGGIPYYPFVVAPNNPYLLVFFLQDDSTASSDLQNVRVKFSNDPENFTTGATTINGTFLNLGQYDLWVVNFNTNAYPIGSTVYFRMFLNDGDHTNDTEFPHTGLNPYYQTYYAFYVQ